MFKKIVLVGLLVMLLSSVVYAFELLNEKTDEDIELTSNIDNYLWVWLEVPENLPSPGQNFLVDVYISTSRDKLGDFTIKLVQDNKKALFSNSITPPKVMAPQGVRALYNALTSDINPSNKLIISPGTDGSVVIIGEVGGDDNLNLRRHFRYFLGSLTATVQTQGKFDLLLDKQNSKAVYTDNGLMQYLPKQGNTRVIRNTLCIPIPNPCSGKCGKVDNGCGKIVSCSGSCAQGSVCVANKCETVVSLLPSSDKELCEAVLKVPETADKTLLQKMGETLSGWGQSCTTNTECKAGYPNCLNNKCTATPLSVLSPIFAALTDWLGIKFP